MCENLEYEKKKRGDRAIENERYEKQQTPINFYYR